MDGAAPEEMKRLAFILVLLALPAMAAPYEVVDGDTLKTCEAGKECTYFRIQGFNTAETWDNRDSIYLADLFDRRGGEAPAKYSFQTGANPAASCPAG
jgi:hypothetical protein